MQATLSHYRVLEQIGEGGMGVVYRAHDEHLDCDVALKVLPAGELADDENRRRFRKEALALSKVQHPNIAVIHDFDTQDGTDFLVEELIPGLSLSEMLISGPLPVREIISIASQLCEGLAAAHEQGIVHRDLKPGNIRITPDARVKILDFGLAKVLRRNAIGNERDATVSLTETQTVSGTLPYMAPEQLLNEKVDTSNDIWAAGCVLYEMAAGQRPFHGSGPALTDAILHLPPPSLSAADHTLSGLEAIVLKCLEKEPALRYQSAKEVVVDLRRLQRGASSSGARNQPTQQTSASVPGVSVISTPIVPRKRWVWPVVAIAILVLGFASATILFRTHPAEPPIIQTLTFSGVDANPAAAPDGRSVVFTSLRDGKQRIWLKQLPAGAEVPVTAGPDFEPRFSPDGSMIAFSRQEGGKEWVYRAAIVGGETRKLAEGRSPDWHPDGKQITFVRDESIWVIQADGSAPRELHRFEGRNWSLRALRWSPNGRWLAMQSTMGSLSPAGMSLLLLSRDGTQVVKIKPSFGTGDFSAVVWAGNDEILYFRSARESVIQYLNTSPSRLIQQKVPSGEAKVLLWLPGGAGAVDFLGRGRLVADLVTSRESLRQVDLGDRKWAGERWLTRGSSLDRQPVFSPDGKWIAFSSNRSGNLDIWAMSVSDGTVRRLTDDSSDDWDPAFTPDGKLVWSSRRSGNFEIWMAEADGSGAHQVSHDGTDAENPSATPDGWVLYVSGSGQPGLWRVLSNGTQAKLILPGDCSWPEVSPDGQFVMSSWDMSAFTRGQGSMPPVGGYIAVHRIADGTEVVRIPMQQVAGRVLSQGRARWMPDGRSIVFIDTDEHGVVGLYQQDFAPLRDTSATRRLLLNDADRQPETFGIAPDGRRIIYGVIDLQSNLLTLDGIAGIER